MNYIYRVALPVPLRRLFDYRAPVEPSAGPLCPGVRVRVPFGRQTLIGVVVGVATHSAVPAQRLRAIAAVLDRQPVWTEASQRLLHWAVQYYQAAPGEVWLDRLPVRLRTGAPLQSEQTQLHYCVAAKAWPKAAEALKRAPRQWALLQWLQSQAWVSRGAVQAAGFRPALLQALVDGGWVTTQAERVAMPQPIVAAGNTPPQAPLALNGAQADAVHAICTALGQPGVFALDGVTGSGKTEVYLQAVAAVLAHGQQALVLVPEIALAPQTVQRFRQRFAESVQLSHSGLSDQARLAVWQQASSGQAAVLIGTRSAVWLPMPNLGLIVVDEAHDESFRQQTGWRYSARDLAVVRGQQRRCPVVLGSATLSLETLWNCRQGRYTQLRLPERVGAGAFPKVTVLDCRGRRLHHGLSADLLACMQRHVAAKQQVLLFINRRGFAPVLLCHACGWSAQCQHCDAKLTLHLNPEHLRCHHCDGRVAIPEQCGACAEPALVKVGVGTVRVEEAVKAALPGVEVLRIDRDTTRTAAAWALQLARVQQGQAQVLIGTQMLAKGHHFPNVSLVGIIDADAGLYSTEFRATERLAQTLFQVAGRAGRGQASGEVWVQTHVPDHPLIQHLAQPTYSAIAELILAERQVAGLPPYGYLGLLAADADRLDAALAVLSAVRDHLATVDSPVALLGPAPAVMARRAQRYRGRLLLQCATRQPLHKQLKRAIAFLEQQPLERRLHWYVDVDPQTVL